MSGIYGGARDTNPGQQNFGDDKFLHFYCFGLDSVDKMSESLGSVMFILKYIS